MDVELRAVSKTGDLKSYDAFVIGSAVYVGQWRSEAGALLESNVDTLKAHPVWLFSSGLTGEGIRWS